MGNEYSTAPVSEVILGLTWEGHPLSKNGQLFEILSNERVEYEHFGYRGPLAEMDVDTDSQSVAAELNPFDTGPALYRIRSKDRTWIIQAQFNKLYLSWARDDLTVPGEYPGYQTIYSKFSNLIEKYRLPSVGIKYCELTYLDRFFWQDHIQDLGSLNEILNYQPPVLTAKGVKRAPTNIRNNYLMSIPEIDAQVQVSITTGEIVEGKQVLSFQCNLSGNHGKTMEFQNWFEEAHRVQNEVFKTFFRDSTLGSWK